MLESEDLAPLLDKLDRLTRLYDTVSHLKIIGVLNAQPAQGLLDEIAARCRRAVESVADVPGQAEPCGLRYIVFDGGEAEVFDGAPDFIETLDIKYPQLVHDVTSWTATATAGSIAKFFQGSRAFAVMAVLPDWIKGQ